MLGFFKKLFQGSPSVDSKPAAPVIPDKIEPARPAPVAAPVAAPVTPPKDVFNTVALPLILVFEGGVSNHPADKGGLTNKGIIQKVYDAYRSSKGLALQFVVNISDAEVSDIYLKNYWLPSKCDQMGDKLSVAVFDTSVNSGPGRSVKILQQAIGAKVDGVIGQETISKLKDFDISKLANTYMDKREDFYNGIVKNDPTQQVFLKGWLRRLNSLRDYVNGVKTLEQIKKEW